jgi:hypothetical protein
MSLERSSTRSSITTLKIFTRKSNLLSKNKNLSQPLKMEEDNVKFINWESVETMEKFVTGLKVVCTL